MRAVSRRPVGLIVLCTLLFPVMAAAQTPHPAFEVASVKPAPPGADPASGSWSAPGKGRFSASHVSLARLLLLAYGIDDSQIANKPEWLETNLYDVAAEPEEGITLTREELRPRLQELLRVRFHLVAHLETRSSRGYALTVTKDAARRLTPTKADHFPGFRIDVSPGQMKGANWTITQLATYLTPAAGFPVVDQTGIAGSYDIGFSYEAGTDSESTLPSLNVALKQATGLLLKPQTVWVQTLVIESVDKMPTAN